MKGKVELDERQYISIAIVIYYVAELTLSSTYFVQTDRRTTVHPHNTNIGPDRYKTKDRRKRGKRYSEEKENEKVRS